MEIKLLDKYKHSPNKNDKYYLADCQNRINLNNDTTQWIEIKDILKKDRDIFILSGVIKY
jgi:hypothetical protein